MAAVVEETLDVETAVSYSKEVSSYFKKPMKTYLVPNLFALFQDSNNITNDCYSHVLQVILLQIGHHGVRYSMVYKNLCVGFPHSWWDPG